MSSGGVWLPSYTIGELQCQLIKLKSGISVDPVFLQLIHKAQEAQRSELIKIRNKHIIGKYLNIIERIVILFNYENIVHKL